MTAAEPPIPQDRQLDATDIRYLFDSLSSHLHQAGSAGHHLMIAGGAALALMWADRTTHDVDVLEHRFRAPHHQHAQRRTAAVDFISMRFPAELVTAARRVADAEGLPRNWLNGAVAIFTPGCDLHPQVLHQSASLTVEAPSARVLLAMKLHAAREQDLQDAARLARDTAITDPEQLLDLVAHAYGTDAATSHTALFADRAVALALRDSRTHQQRFDRGDGLEL
ncbi:MAG: hypothetical protein OXH54_16425 [Acidimicrobiaceae bacterium]|nr:hypothetical protein [Acidimicrobiaceae bacterium]